jgi:hypothetical protein
MHTESEQYHAGFRGHMPLDMDIHWDWGNPLNILPILLLVIVVGAILGPFWL